MRSLGNLDLSAIRRQHPHRNFQASPRWVDVRYSAISPLRPADHLKDDAIKRMEWVEDLGGRVFYAQDIVSVDAFTRTFIVSFPRAASLPITPVGSTHEKTTSFPRKSCAKSFAQVRQRSRAGFSEWSAQLPCRPEAAGKSQDLRRLATTTVSRKVGGVLEASLRWPRLCAAISRPLHPSRGHLQPPPGLLCRWPSHLSLARFR
jgi:hypothetical protein